MYTAVLLSIVPCLDRIKQDMELHTSSTVASDKGSFMNNLRE